MTPDQAADALFCALSDSTISINRSDIAPIQAYHIKEDGNPVLSIRIGDAKNWVSVTFLGNKGQEKAIDIERNSIYDSEKKVLVKDIDDAVLKKYGHPSEFGIEKNRSYYRWIRDPAGVMKDKSDKIFEVCSKVDEYNLYAASTKCGNVLIAYVDPSKVDPKIADEFHVVLLNHSEALDIVKAINEHHAAASSVIADKPRL